MDLKTKDFSYDLPLELIAQEPVSPRDHSRLLVLNKKNGDLSHHHFYDLPKFLKSGDLLVLNNSKVFPARLKGVKKETGGRIEIFLHQSLKSADENIWECLIGGRVKEGYEIEFENSGLKAVVLKNNNDATWQVKFNHNGEIFWSSIENIGEVPLPPYIKRLENSEKDRNSYQTIYADEKERGSAAAPTAGLHFTEELLSIIKSQGVKIKYVTLHVGMGTFAPVKEEKIIDHKMHREFASVSSDVIKEIINTKKKGGRIIAVGTTSCRTLESLNWSELYNENEKNIKDISFWTDIFIYPGYKFQAVDSLVTNFHLPASTLLMLISALAGKEKIDRAYQEAIKERYRFFSYGDAMFIME